jgi:hypothetical protein
MSDNSTATTPVDSREAQQGKGMRVSGEPGSELAAPPVGTSPASAANDAAGERPGGPDIDRDLHRLLAGAVTDHLERAAALLRQDPTVDALLLGAGGAAKVIAVLSTAATRIGVPLPSEAVQAIQGLHVWAFTVRDDAYKQGLPPSGSS